jgi:pimeloyl-ACP methyl ester carboxylesterase
MRDIVFLHGGGQGGWVWDETIAAIAQQSGGAARCLALDGPGCGANRGRDIATISWDELNDELVADVAASPLRGAMLVGHSQAGTHLPVLAARGPELFGKLVFVSCVVPDPGLTVIEMTGQRMRAEVQTQGNAAFADPAMPMRERFRAMFCNDMPPAWAETFLDKLGADTWPASCYAQNAWSYEHLADLPVSYVLCLRDAILPLAWQERFADRVRARTTHRIDAGHQVMNTRPQALAEVLLLEAAG